MKRILGGLGLGLVIACAGQIPAVHVDGDPLAVAHLAGNWSGEYRGGANGRRGSLSFSLRSGSDSLYGDVLMVDQMGNVVRPADPAEIHQRHVRAAQALRIDFVGVVGNSVRGTLEPYISPDCDCTVLTTFFGELKDDAISGAFETRSGPRVIGGGSWKMSRTAMASR